MGKSKAARRSRRSAIVFMMAFVAFALIAGFVVTSLIPGLLLRAQQQRDIAAQQAELARVKAENTRLRDQITRLSDPAYLEVLARSRMLMAKKGERVFKVLDVPSKETTPVSRPAPRTDPWWDRAWRWLVDKPSKLRF